MSEESDEHAIVGPEDRFVGSPIDAADRAPIVRDRSLVVEISDAVVGQRSCIDLGFGLRKARKGPGAEPRSGFEH